MQVEHVRHRPTPAEPWVIVDFADPRAGQVVLQVRPGHFCQLPTDRQPEQFTSRICSALCWLNLNYVHPLNARDDCAGSACVATD